LIRPRIWLCDFDGTVAPEDVGASFMERFSPGHDAERQTLLDSWRSERIGSRELAAAECAFVRATETTAVAFAERFAVDPDFAGFAREVEARGDRILIVSDGFDFYIHPLLAAAGLGHLPVASNRMRFTGDRLEPEFPNDGGCGRCGNCKAQYVEANRARGFETVLVGDGYSDRCAARVADRVVARGSLSAWCAAEGIPARVFESFADVTRIAREWAGQSGAGDGWDRATGAVA
jgi:2-hydroxy-3-keto-5-methylthiopentenyl-1-phosphate phosphatase